MKRLHAMLFLMCVAVSSVARADSMVSGSVSSMIFAGGSCTQSGGPASSLSLSCSDASLPAAYASLMGSTGSTSGWVTAGAESMVNMSNPLTFESVNFNLSVTGMYELTGGTGLGNAALDFGMFLHGGGGGGDFSECLVTLDGQTQNCYGGGNLSFLVPYNTPLSLDFEAQYAGDAEFGDGINSGVTYDFSALTPVSPVPEPASLVLMGMALIPLIGRFRRRG